MRAFADAQRSAWQARRVVDARRTGPLTGCVAGLVAAGGAAAILDMGPSMVFFWLVYEIPFVIMMVWIFRTKSTAQVQVVDHIQASWNRAPRRRVLTYILAGQLAAFLFASFWSWAFEHMNNQMIGITIIAMIVAVSAAFVVRFIKFLFWEDLFFAAGVPLGWGGYIFGQAFPPLRGATQVAPLLVLVGVVCLYNRYRHVVPTPRVANPSEAGPT